MALNSILADSISAPDSIPEGLLEAFESYERALLSNDVATLNSLFAPGPDTIRGDGTNLLIGHDAIVGFRSARTSIPTRRVAQLFVRSIDDDNALVMASTIEPSTNSTGLQTQLWRRDGAWHVVAAHVTLPKKATAPRPATPYDASVWRVLGDPLVPARAEGPLSGVTLAVKDLFAVEGHRLGCGNPQYLSEQAPQFGSAPVVVSLLEAGAEITGIACTDEFAYGLAGQNEHYGTAPNPQVPGAVGGGSTSGPAAAVALGQVAVGLGTDTAGSIRVPASYQGLVGIRSTHGALGTAGVAPLAPSFDTIGWLTRDVQTSLAVAEHLLPATRRGQIRRTVVLPCVDAYADPAVAAACASARTALIGTGALPPASGTTPDIDATTLESWFIAFRTVQAFEAWQSHGDWITANPGALGHAVAQRFAVASGVTEDAAAAARTVVDRARIRLREFLADAVLVLPAASGGAPAIDAPADVIEADRAATLHLTVLAGLAGAPAVSIPLLHSPDGKPVGLCLVGAPATDLDLLDLARRIERTRL
ncbi:AtzH-like domain-containing protein [Rhodococcus pyridinivorans]